MLLSHAEGTSDDEIDIAMLPLPEKLGNRAIQCKYSLRLRSSKVECRNGKDYARTNRPGGAERTNVTVLE